MWAGYALLKGFPCFFVYGKEEHEDMETPGEKCNRDRTAGMKQDDDDDRMAVKDTLGRV